MNSFGLCYCNDQIFLLFPPSLSVSLVYKGPFCCPVQICLCVWLWENILTVRESPPLSGLPFPLRSSRLKEAEPHHCSGGLLPATPGGGSSHRIPLLSLLRTTLFFLDVCMPCPHILSRLRNIVYLFRRGGSFRLFTTVIKKLWKKNTHHQLITSDWGGLQWRHASWCENGPGCSGFTLANAAVPAPKLDTSTEINKIYCSEF